MKIPLKIERVSDNFDCYEDITKYIKYKIINDNRFIVTDIDVDAHTVKEDGEKTKSNYCKNTTGIKSRLMPNDECEITCTIKMPKDYSETFELDGETILSACDLDISVTGTLIIART
jgi:hypothetical protein